MPAPKSETADAERELEQLEQLEQLPAIAATSTLLKLYIGLARRVENLEISVSGILERIPGEEPPAPEIEASFHVRIPDGGDHLVGMTDCRLEQVRARRTDTGHQLVCSACGEVVLELARDPF